MRKILGNLQLKWNNYTNTGNGEGTDMSDVGPGLGKDIFDEKLLSLQEDMSDILKEHEQRKQAIETLVENFKTAAEKRFSRMKKEEIQ